MFHNIFKVKKNFHNQMKGFTRINDSMVKTTFAFMMHLMVLHWSSRVVKVRIGEDTTFDHPS
jgi:hypothetical protein